MKIGRWNGQTRKLISPPSTEWMHHTKQRILLFSKIPETVLYPKGCLFYFCCLLHHELMQGSRVQNYNQVGDSFLSNNFSLITIRFLSFLYVCQHIRMNINFSKDSCVTEQNSSNFLPTLCIRNILTFVLWVLQFFSDYDSLLRIIKCVYLVYVVVL